MIDNMWEKWNDLPKVMQDEMKEQLGSSFVRNFMTKETRNYDSITPEQMQIWLKLTGGNQVGKLNSTVEAMIELNQLKLTNPETAWRVQTFYDGRDQFQNWYKSQEE